MKTGRDIVTWIRVCFSFGIGQFEVAGDWR